jgi:competence ComEA-like helix-hairpin-helix protein
VQQRHGPIDLASATEDDLRHVVGVGPALAGRIVAWRDRNGGFTSVEQLAQVKGIGGSTMELLRPQVIVRPAQSVLPPEQESGPATPIGGALHDDALPPAEGILARLRSAVAGADPTLVGLAAGALFLLVVALVVWAV